MKRAGIILGVIILLGCAVGLVFTYAALGHTQDALDETRATLSEVEETQQDTARTLEEAQAELSATTDSLEETRQALDEQKSQADTYAELYQDASDELKETLDELDSLEEQQRAMEVLFEEIHEKLALYEDTLGTQVFSGVLPPYNSGYLADLVLTDNATAKDPTWKELLDFLYDDRTDEYLYVEDVYMCGSFAMDLHNNAEAHGIRAAFVAIHFYNEIPHAVNAFKTTDKGLVYIDATGFLESLPVPYLDKKAEISKDKAYIVKFILRHDYYIEPGDAIVKSIEIYW